MLLKRPRAPLRRCTGINLYLAKSSIKVGPLEAIDGTPVIDIKPAL
jgi:tRNA (Thr-GGU) A37 N-methylase